MNAKNPAPAPRMTNPAYTAILRPFEQAEERFLRDTCWLLNGAEAFCPLNPAIMIAKVQEPGQGIDFLVCWNGEPVYLSGSLGRAMFDAGRLFETE